MKPGSQSETYTRKLIIKIVYFGMWRIFSFSLSEPCIYPCIIGSLNLSLYWMSKKNVLRALKSGNKGHFFKKPCIILEFIKHCKKNIGVDQDLNITLLV